MKYYLVIIFTLILCILVNGQTGPCSYSANGETYDISPIGYTDYPVIATDGTGTFYTRFCGKTDYNCNQPTSVCLLRPDGQTKYNCGQAWLSKGWSLTSNNPVTLDNLYPNGSVCSGGIYRSTDIQLVCNMTAPKPFWVKSATLSNCKYSFELHTCYVCDSPCSGSNNSLGFDIGWLLIVIVFSLFIVYLIIGAVVKWKVYNAEGLELIPNWGFWSDLPLLIKDGVFYLVGLVTGNTSYAKV